MTPATRELARVLDAAIQLKMRIACADRGVARLLDRTTVELRIAAQRDFNAAFLK